MLIYCSFLIAKFLKLLITIDIEAHFDQFVNKPGCF